MQQVFKLSRKLLLYSLLFNPALVSSQDASLIWDGGIKTATGDDVSHVVDANDKMWQFFQNNSLCSVSVQNPNEFTATVAPKPFEDQITLSHNYNTNAHEVHYLP
jgi:hypothetical protein